MEKQHQGKRAFFREQFSKDGSEGVWLQKNREWYNQAIAHFRSREYHEDPNSAKIITWRNAVCDKLNAQIRGELIGVTEPFTPGEVLVAREAVVKEGTVVIPTASCAMVEEVKPGSLAEVVPSVLRSIQVPKIPLYRLKLRYGTEIVRTATVCTKDRSLLESFLKRAIDKSRYYKRQGDKHKAKVYREAFWELKESISDLTYGYGLTVRRSQGKTFGSVFVHLNDLLYIRSPKERWRSVYVAVSRTRKRLFILI